MNYRSFHFIFFLSVTLIPRASAQTKPPADAVSNILPEGAFDTKSNQFFAGWRAGGFLGGVPGESRMWDNSVTMETDKSGMGFARLRVADSQGTSIGISQTEPLVINPAWKTLNLHVSVRVTNYFKVADWGGCCQFSLAFKDINDQPIKGDFKTDIRRNTSDWEEIVAMIAIPAGAANMSVNIEFMGATGVIDIGNLRVFPSDNH